jgi:sphingolipid delta-4 desaturase
MFNRLLGLFCNIGIPVPIAQGFRRYHLEHHTYQGVDGYDPDLPLEWELHLVRGNTWQKVLWVLIFPVMYVARGAAQGKSASKWELINYAWTITTDSLVVYFCGWRGLGYLLCSLWMGYSLHPAAAHFIQEHYTFEDGQETYSYYGSGNTFMMNIGFHNEHHDFATVPWSKLPALRAMAPEFYEPLKYHSSWFWLLYKFLTSPVMGPQSRVARSVDDHRMARKMLKRVRTTEHPMDRKDE